MATPEHVEMTLAAGLDGVWVGARTTTNPFATQQIADALRGADVAVLVKNPVIPDVDLWVGAIERIYNSGVRRLCAVHRGFGTHETTPYRNAPHWSVPIELHRRLPSLPILCDPSHIGGRRDMIASLSQQALDIGFDGLMIESHCNPAVALSDSKQQLVPEALNTLLEGLKWRAGSSSSESFQTSLLGMREQIDSLDREIIKLLSERMKVAEDIGRIKRENDVRILQFSRWEDIVERALAQNKSLGLSEQFLRTILDAIHVESIDRQNRVMNE